MNSKLELIKPIEKKTIVVKQLFGEEGVIAGHEKRLKEVYPNDTPEQITNRLNNIILKDNAFNYAMQEMVSHFKFIIDSDDTDKIKVFLKNYYKNPSNDFMDIMSDKTLKKTLIFEYLKNEWKLEVSDDEVKKSLEQFYEMTNQPIRKFLEDKKEFENVRNSIMEDKVMNKMFQVFTIDFQLEDLKNEKKDENKKEEIEKK